MYKFARFFHAVSRRGSDSGQTTLLCTETGQHFESRMYAFLLAAIILTGTTTSSSAVEETEIENITDDLGHALTLNITHKGTEEEIDVIDADGNHVINVEMMEANGYQIDKPADENVCLLSELEEFENKTYCYDRINYPESNMTQEVQDHCVGREIYVLVQRDCSADETETDVTKPPSDEDQNRVKRSWFCYWRRYYTLRFYRVTRCCRRFLFFCTRRCVVRYKWRWVRISTYRCSYYG